MYLSLALIAGFAALYSIVAGGVEKTWISGPIVFTVFGLIIGPTGFDLLSFDTDRETLKVLAELTLALVLFSDAAGADLKVLRRNAWLPARLLLSSRLTRGRQRRSPAIGRIDYERRSAVGAYRALPIVHAELCPVIVNRGWINGRVLRCPTDEGRDGLLLRVELLVPEVLGSLERREGLGRPVALEVRLPVRGARDGPTPVTRDGGLG